MNPTALDLSSLRGAVASLEDALEVAADEAWFTRQSAKVRNTLMAGVIQNFEFVYELSYKMIRRRIELDAASPREVDDSNFRDVLRFAGDIGLVGDVAAWFNYRRMRNITAHTYDHDKARRIHRDIAAFAADAQALLARLDARNG